SSVVVNVLEQAFMAPSSRTRKALARPSANGLRHLTVPCTPTYELFGPRQTATLANQRRQEHINKRRRCIRLSNGATSEPGQQRSSGDVRLMSAVPATAQRQTFQHFAKVPQPDNQGTEAV